MTNVKAKWIGVALTLAAGMAWGAPMDARISNTHGKSVWLAQLWGKPTVMFYEDKDSTSQNQALKDELFKQGRERGLLDSVSVIAIANVRGFDWFPAKNFVVGAVKDAQKRSGLPVYLDWSGRLSSKPWSLSATGSTVMVIDATGERVLFSKTGQLTEEESRQVLELLGTLVGR